jgi:hypothetical protein
MGRRLTFGKRRCLTLPSATQFFHFLSQLLDSGSGTQTLCTTSVLRARKKFVLPAPASARNGWCANQLPAGHRLLVAGLAAGDEHQDAGRESDVVVELRALH